MKFRTNLRVETLEDRTVPANTGIPWFDPKNLTVSFAPEGTRVAGHSSSFASLNARMAPAVWRAALLRAAQTWAVQANLNFGVVADSGLPFGAPGRTQSDARIGDIRIGSHKMSREVSSISVPPDPFFSGTLAGDLFLNSNVAFTPAMLQAVALHEFGHALGLPHTTDTTSVMFSHFNQRTTLSAGDIARIRALYGTRGADRWDAAIPNNSIPTATRIKYSEDSDNYSGATPLIVWGDITSTSDDDFFWIEPLDDYTGAMTFRLQTRGLSLLAPKLTIYDEFGTVLRQASSTLIEGGILRVTLPSVDPELKYYAKVEGATFDAFGVGRFALGVTFDARLQTSSAQYDNVIRGPFDAIDEDDLDEIFTSPNSVLTNDDAHTDDFFPVAVSLRSTPGYAINARYNMPGSLRDLRDRDVYRIKSPTNGNNVMLIDATASVTNGAIPDVIVYDRNFLPVASKILANGNGTFRLQVANTRAGSDYYLLVRVSRTGQLGNYDLDVHFGRTAATVTLFAAGSLSTSNQQNVHRMYVAQTQFFGLTLTAPGSAGYVKMDILNASRRVIATLAAPFGGTVSGPSVLLTPGAYFLRFQIFRSTTLSYRLEGSSLTIPLGPVLDDPTLLTLYLISTNPNLFEYPNQVVSPNPFLTLVPPNTPPSGLTFGVSHTTNTVVVSGSFADPDPLDTHTVTIFWGDGSNSLLSLAAGVLSFSASHTYADPLHPPSLLGFPIQITVSDGEGGSTTNVNYVRF